MFDVKHLQPRLLQYGELFFPVQIRARLLSSLQFVSTRLLTSLCSPSLVIQAPIAQVQSLCHLVLHRLLWKEDDFGFINHQIFHSTVR